MSKNWTHGQFVYVLIQVLNDNECQLEETRGVLKLPWPLLNLTES